MTTSRQSTPVAEAMRKRNLRTGWILGGVSLAIALSVWYARLG